MTELSFLICTRNRADALGRCLDSVAAGLAPHPGLAAEIVVIDNGSTDGTPQLVEGWAGRHAVPVTLRTESREGLSRARNTAFRHATGRLMACIDDDCTLGENYVADLLRHDRADKAPVMRGGRVSLGDPQDLRFTVKESTHAHRLGPERHPAMVLLGCNMVIPRIVADTVGAFDARFGAGAPMLAAEDTDYCYRVGRAGFVVEYVPDMQVLHFHGRRRLEDIRALEKRYNFGNGAFAAKWMFRDAHLARSLFWMLRQRFNPRRRRQIVRADIGTTWGEMLDDNIAGAMAWFRMAGIRQPRMPEAA